MVMLTVFPAHLPLDLTSALRNYPFMQLRIFILNSLSLTSLQSFQEHLPKPQQKVYGLNSVQFILIQQEYNSVAPLS